MLPKEKKMTKEEYEKVIETIKKHQVVIADSCNRPRLALTTLGLVKVEEDLKKLIK